MKEIFLNYCPVVSHLIDCFNDWFFGIVQVYLKRFCVTFNICVLLIIFYWLQTLNQNAFSFMHLTFKPFQSFTSSKIFFAFNQLTRCLKLALVSLFSFLIELLRHNRLVSSRKWWTLQNFIAWLWLFIYNKNRRGPRTDPWGT